MIESLPEDPKLSERVRSVYRKAWKAFPEHRFYLVGAVHREEIWQMPEMYELAREAIIPAGATSSTIASWYPFIPISIGSALPTTALPTPPIVKPAVSRFLDLAASQGRLDELAGQIEAARKANTDWTAGDATLALVHCRTGKYGEAGMLVRKLCDQIKKNEVAGVTAGLMYALWTVGLELEQHPATRDLAVAAYESAMGLPSAFLQFRFQSDRIPARRLVDIYVRDGRRDDARLALLKMARSSNFPDTAAKELINRYKMQALAAVAGWLVELGFTSDAIPMYTEALTLVDWFDSFAPNYFTGDAVFEQLPRQLRDGLDAAIQDISPAELAHIASRKIAEASKDEDQAKGKDRSKPNKAKPRDQAIDLLTLTYPRELDRTAVRSLLAESIAACDAQQLAALDKPLEVLTKAHPDDLSVAITIALRALASADRRASRQPWSASPGCWSNRPLNRCHPAAGPTPGNGPRQPGRSRSGWSPAHVAC